MESIKVKVSIDVILPPEAEQCTPKEIEDWLRFNLNDNDSLGPSPISDCELIPVPFTIDVEYL